MGPQPNRLRRLQGDLRGRLRTNPTPFMPPNWDFVGFGDSRTENGIGAALTASGYIPVSLNHGPVGWLPLVTGNRLRFGRFPNFGISASNTSQGAANGGAAGQRQNALGNVTAGSWYRGGGATNFSANKAAGDAAAHPAGVVVLLYGTNDPDANLASVSRANISTILTVIGSSKLVIMLNETPEGVDVSGTSPGTGSGPSSDNLLAYSQWLAGLDHASGQPHARPNVVVVDTWALVLDPAASGPNNRRAKQGFLRDGLHFTPWGARAVAQAIHDRLTAVYGSAYTGLPAQVVLPTANGFAAAAAVAPFIHTNPVLTPGGAGQVFTATFATTPAAAAIPQGWFLQGSGAVTGLSVAVDKTLTDADGFPMCRLTVTGSLANNATAQVQLATQALAAGQLAITDRLRGVGRFRLEPGSAGLTDANLQVFVNTGTGTTSMLATAMQGSQGGTGDRLGYTMNANGFDAGGFNGVLLTELLDLQEPGMAAANGGPGNVTAVPSVTCRCNLNFQNFTGAALTVAADLYVSRCGVFRAVN